MVQRRSLGGVALRVLITGGFGFVGGCVARYLQDAGCDTVLGTRKAIEIADWLPRARVLQTNWCDVTALEHACIGIDVIIHAAGMNSAECAENPVAALEFNGVATARLVMAATRAGVKRFIYLSTAHVYASPLVGRISERTWPNNLHAYATSNLAGELAVLQNTKQGELESIVLRLSNVFGTPAHKDVKCWNLLVNDVCRQAIQTRRILLHTCGLQHRDFVSMTEVCKVVASFVLRHHTKQIPVIFNVGTGVSQTVLEMAQLIQIHCNKVLGFLPELHRPITTTGQVTEPLYYEVENLRLAGLKMIKDPTEEIGRLLQFCDTHFGSSRER